MVRYCNVQIKLSCLSIEQLLAEMKMNIIRKYYRQRITDAKEEDKKYLPTYNELLDKLDLKSLALTTIWRWLRFIGYKYNNNKRSYYTDEHERPNVVTGWDNIFLKSYFAAELRCHQWIQITKETAVWHLQLLSDTGTRRSDLSIPKPTDKICIFKND